METTWWTQPEDLDESQKEVVALEPNQDHLVVGPPGSGKTNLLILRAAYLYASGQQNIAVLTFGRVLREFLAAGSANYTFPTDKIQTYIKWGTGLLAANGVGFNEKGKFSDVKEKMQSRLLDLSKSGSAENIFDCILLDESQDYSPEEITIIRSFARHIFAVGDNGQTIYDATGSLDALAQSIGPAKILPFHYRNGLKICRFADGIRNLVDAPNGLQATSNYDEKRYPSSVTVRPGLSVQKQVEVAVPEILTQLRAYPDGMIGILCPRHKELEQAWKEISGSPLAAQAQLQQYSDGYGAFDPDHRIVVTTTHGAKGLEFRALHLLGMDKISKFRQVQRNLAYTAVTRAKTSLSIYHEGSLPGYVERGIVAAQGGVLDTPKLAELFKKGST